MFGVFISQEYGRQSSLSGCGGADSGSRGGSADHGGACDNGRRSRGTPYGGDDACGGGDRKDDPRSDDEDDNGEGGGGGDGGRDGSRDARESFRARLSLLIIPALQERQFLQITIFVQDGATSHVGQQVKTLPSASFGGSRDCPDIFRKHGLLAHPT
ncbi:hypothetical protein TNCV_831341 [Trichonephila clavipes]|nr:hypothetical protein TNCV_831341 [Trichonephila clavipes]